MRMIAILILASGAVWAQRPVTSPSGYGRILFPGGGGPSTSVPNAPGGFGRAINPGTAAPVNSGVGMTFVGGPPPLSQPVQNNRRGQSGIVAVPYPIYMNGYGGNLGFNSNWNWGYGPDPNQAQYMNYVPVASQQSQQDPPVVIVNQYFTGDGRQVSSQPSAAAQQNATAVAPEVTRSAEDKDTIFMIAMKDHSIYAANAYWVEDGTLNYVTIQGAQNSVSLDLVDRELSQRLNRERRIAFGLPTR